MQVAAQHHAIAHTLPHAYYANPQGFPEGTLEHLLRGEGDPNDAAHQHAVVSCLPSIAIAGTAPLPMASPHKSKS